MNDRLSSTTEFLSRQLSDPKSHWSIGTFGAIAEFCHFPEEEVIIDRGERALTAVTMRGAISIRIDGDFRLFASESLAWQGWSQRVAICLNVASASMNRRSVLTELSADHGALRPEDRNDIMFDLGLGAPHVDFCVRVKDDRTKRHLRKYVGRPLYDAGNPALAIIMDASPPRVFESTVGRIEIFQRIPVHGESSPEGPHTHVLPRLLKQRRTHSATEPVPLGTVPCLHVYPWHPADVSLGNKPSFNIRQHNYFQAVLRSFGDPRVIAIKDRVIASVLAKQSPPAQPFAQNRVDRASVRIALRQLRAANQKSDALAEWLALYDRPCNGEIEAEFEQELCIPTKPSSEGLIASRSEPAAYPEKARNITLA